MELLEKKPDSQRISFTLSDEFRRMRLLLRPHRLTVRTSPSQGANRGSIPRGAATIAYAIVLRLILRLK